MAVKFILSPTGKDYKFGIPKQTKSCQSLLQELRGANFTTFVMHDGVGNLWIGTDGAGLLKFTGDKYVTYHHNPYNYRSIIGDEINVGFQDRDGALWFGGRVGVSKFDPSLKLFNLFNQFEIRRKTYEQ